MSTVTSRTNRNPSERSDPIPDPTPAPVSSVSDHRYCSLSGATLDSTDDYDLMSSVSHDDRDMVPDVISDVRSILLSSMSNPILVVLTVVMFATIISSGPTASEGVIGGFMNASGNTTVSRWIRASPMKFYGMLSFAPSVYSLPRKFSFVAAFVAFLWVLIVPEYTVFEYFIQSTSLFIYFQTRQKDTKIAVVVFALLAYYFGFVIIAPA